MNYRKKRNINTTGYLDGATTANNPYNIIPGDGNSTTITMDGVSTPIMANGEYLPPNSGEYFFDDPYVLETPYRSKQTFSMGGPKDTNPWNPYKQLPGVIERVRSGELTSEEAGTYLKSWRTTPEGTQYMEKNFNKVFGPSNSLLGMYDNNTQTFFRYDGKEAARAKVNQPDEDLNSSRKDLENFLKQRGLSPTNIFRKGGSRKC